MSDSLCLLCSLLRVVIQGVVSKLIYYTKMLLGFQNQMGKEMPWAALLVGIVLTPNFPHSLVASLLLDWALRLTLNELK